MNFNLNASAVEERGNKLSETAPNKFPTMLRGRRLIAITSFTEDSQKLAVDVSRKRLYDELYLAYAKGKLKQITLYYLDEQCLPECVHT